jgi:hypothetical protein
MEGVKQTDWIAWNEAIPTVTQIPRNSGFWLGLVQIPPIPGPPQPAFSLVAPRFSIVRQRCIGQDWESAEMRQVGRARPRSSIKGSFLGYWVGVSRFLPRVNRSLSSRCIASLISMVGCVQRSLMGVSLTLSSPRCFWHDRRCPVRFRCQLHECMDRNGSVPGILQPSQL